MTIRMTLSDDPSSDTDTACENNFATFYSSLYYPRSQSGV